MLPEKSPIIKCACYGTMNYRQRTALSTHSVTAEILKLTIMPSRWECFMKSIAYFTPTISFLLFFSQTGARTLDQIANGTVHAAAEADLMMIMRGYAKKLNLKKNIKALY